MDPCVHKSVVPGTVRDCLRTHDTIAGSASSSVSSGPTLTSGACLSAARARGVQHPRAGRASLDERSSRVHRRVAQRADRVAREQDRGLDFSATSSRGNSSVGNDRGLDFPATSARGNPPAGLVVPTQTSHGSYLGRAKRVRACRALYLLRYHPGMVLAVSSSPGLSLILPD